MAAGSACAAYVRTFGALCKWAGKEGNRDNEQEVIFVAQRWQQQQLGG